MDERMAEKDQATALIDEYTRLQRIKAAKDRDEEIEYSDQNNQSQTGGPGNYDRAS